MPIPTFRLYVCTSFISLDWHICVISSRLSFLNGLLLSLVIINLKYHFLLKYWFCPNSKAFKKNICQASGSTTFLRFNLVNKGQNYQQKYYTMVKHLIFIFQYRPWNIQSTNCNCWPRLAYTSKFFQLSEPTTSFFKMHKWTATLITAEKL